MATRADLRTILRRDKLDDNSAGKYRWGDETLHEAINEAIRDYSQHFPRKRRAAIARVAGQTEYNLPADFKQVGYLTDTAGVRYSPLNPGDYEERLALDRGGEEGGIPYRELGERFSDGQGAFYAVWGGSLYLAPAPQEDLALYYLAWHPQATADSSALTIPEEDEDLIVLYAWAVCLSRDSGKDALLSRWDEGSGRRDDNPVVFLSTRFFHAYREKVAERKALREGGGS